MNLPPIRTNNSIPLYLQIKESLDSAIEGQEMLPGEKIPSLDKLCKIYDVSRLTARQAVQELVCEGKLHTVIGRGTFVSDRAIIEPPMNTIWGFSDSFSSNGNNHLSRLLSLDIQAAGAAVAERLHVSPKRKIYKLSRLRVLNQKPIALEYSHLPADRFPNLESFDWRKASLYSVVRKNYKIKFSQGKQYVEARLPSQKVAQLLEIQPKSPILMMDRTIKSDEGWIIEYAHTFYRADSVRLFIQMSSDEHLALVEAESS
ncbi:MAG: GntR family transcriptional regulator [Chloroflexota bacterium]|nr:GntR family transcriptional regulator [Chloroflexota bacterium]